MKRWSPVMLALLALTAFTVHCGGDPTPQNDAGGTPGDSGGKWDAGAGGDGGAAADGGGSQDGGQPDPNAEWTDAVSGLVWRAVPSGKFFNMQEAVAYCNGLGGTWRLPTISELRSLIRGCPATESAGTCGVKDGCLSYNKCRNFGCDGCTKGKGPASGCYWDKALVAPGGNCNTDGWYWSSSQNPDSKYAYWDVDFDVGTVSYEEDFKYLRVRCVRVK